MKIMKRVKSSGTLGLVTLALLGAHPALAADSGGYVGGNLGEASASIDNDRIIRGLQAGGLATSSMSNDEHDSGFKLFGGYQFNRYFALEGGYADLGQFGFTAMTVPPGSFSGNVKVRGLNLDAVGILPLDEKWSLLGRAGLLHAESRSTFAGTGMASVNSPPRRERDTHYKLGVGVQYAVTESLGLRAEAERHRVNDTVGNDGDIDLISLGMVLRFGGKGAARDTATPVAAEAPPATAVAAVPARPAPVLVVVPVLKKQQQYCSILDLTFEINQEVIQRDDKEKLRVVGTFLKKYPDTTAVIEGHSDNVGTAEHKQQLSTRRAESVVSYLQDDFSIEPSRLTAVGYGDTRPLASNGSEEGMRMNRRINAVIACASDIEGLKVKPARVTMAMMMEFDQNKDEVKPEYLQELRKVAAFLKAHPGTTATVEGHSSNVDPDQALAVSQRRSVNVVNALAEMGVERSRLSADGFGETRRFAYNTSLEGRQENRRVNIIINYVN